MSGVSGACIRETRSKAHLITTSTYTNRKRFLFLPIIGIFDRMMFIFLIKKQSRMAIILDHEELMRSLVI